MPSSSGGRVVRIAYAQSEVEAEMIKGLLSQSGIPSMVRRERGLAMPQHLMAGPCEVCVLESVAEAAREVLAGTPGGEDAESTSSEPG